MDQGQTSIVRACAAVGGQAELARALGVTPSAVSQWCKGLREVPAERCPSIERETRLAAQRANDATLIVTCEQLRADVAWGVLRAQVAPETCPKPAPAVLPLDPCDRQEVTGSDVQGLEPVAKAA